MNVPAWKTQTRKRKRASSFPLSGSVHELDWWISTNKSFYYTNFTVDHEPTNSQVGAGTWPCTWSMGREKKLQVVGGWCRPEKRERGALSHGFEFFDEEEDLSRLRMRMTITSTLMILVIIEYTLTWLWVTCVIIHWSNETILRARSSWSLDRGHFEF